MHRQQLGLSLPADDLGSVSEPYNKQIRELRYVEPDNKVNELEFKARQMDLRTLCNPGPPIAQLGNC